jgi:hypothetical protein
MAEASLLKLSKVLKVLTLKKVFRVQVLNIFFSAVVRIRPVVVKIP